MNGSEEGVTEAGVCHGGVLVFKHRAGGGRDGVVRMHVETCMCTAALYSCKGCALLKNSVFKMHLQRADVVGWCVHDGICFWKVTIRCLI